MKKGVVYMISISWTNIGVPLIKEMYTTVHF